MADNQGNVRFIRRGGKVIPIREKSGSSSAKPKRKAPADARKISSREMIKASDVYEKAAKKHGRDYTKKERVGNAARFGAVLGTGGAATGFLIGAASVGPGPNGSITKASYKLGAKGALVLGAGLGALGAARAYAEKRKRNHKAGDKAADAYLRGLHRKSSV
jgi:hypothetical protein